MHGVFLGKPSITNIHITFLPTSIDEATITITIKWLIAMWFLTAIGNYLHITNKEGSKKTEVSPNHPKSDHFSENTHRTWY